ncbi:hypothetical protein D3C72_2129830 [compost metagenome]
MMHQIERARRGIGRLLDARAEGLMQPAPLLGVERSRKSACHLRVREAVGVTVAQEQPARLEFGAGRREGCRV